MWAAILISPSRPGETPGTAVGVGIAIAVLYFLAGSIYLFVMLSTRGQTIGKRIMKIRVEKTDGSPPGFVVAVLLREIVNLIICCIPLVGTIYALVDALFVFRPDSRCLHDHIASTGVVMADAAPAPVMVPAI